jgi:hypothetical protein
MVMGEPLDAQSVLLAPQSEDRRWRWPSLKNFNPGEDLQDHA